MTEENYNYRTCQTLLRNQFPGKGKLKIPVIPKFQEIPGDFDDLLLIGFDKTHLEDRNHLDRMVHFFLYDYRFERVWKNPESDIEKLSLYRAVLSPDFSMYLEMAPVMQLYNVFRNRWCGAYWASKGIRVIPTVNWGDESTFGFCFDGIEKGSVVAVSTYMASEHDNRQNQKEWFMAGYNEMLRRIEPETIICYNTPFPEMQGNIVYVDYERSSWKYMSYERGFRKEDLDAFKFGGTPNLNRDTIEPFLIGGHSSKGGGRAYGGKWKPSKPDDERFAGEPGTINRTIDRNGNLRETKIGEEGLAVRERHYSDHGNASKHSVPHDHEIMWEENRLTWGKVQNCWDGNIPDFKAYRRYNCNMNLHIQKSRNTLEDNRFKTISDFKWCMRCGGEVELTWKGIHFGIVPYGDGNKISIYLWNRPETEQVFNSSDDALEYIVSGDRLRDVITQVTVLDRTI